MFRTRERKYPTFEQKNNLKEVKEFLTMNSSNLNKQIKAAPVFVKKNCDNRPYVCVQIFSRDVVALLDSGASHSIIGSAGLVTLKMFKLKHNKSEIKFVTTADGTRQVVKGFVDMPVSVNKTCKIIRFLIVPSLRNAFICGSDFCRSFNVRIDFKNNTWDVRNSRNIEIASVDANDYNLGTNKIVISGFGNLSASQLGQVNEIISKFNLLSRDGKLGRTNKFVYHIDTGDAKPIKQRQYLLSPYMLSHLNKELDRMIELDVVEPSSSEWSSPVLLVKKTNGDFRLCFDGRKLNSVTKKDSYPLPQIERILQMLGNARFMSSVDLRSAFWQIPLSRESKEKTAFSIPGRGLFHFKVMPFGLSTAAQCQQRLMDAIFGPELEPHIFVYLDDIIIVSSTFEEHIKLLEVVFSRLQEANLTVSMEKCKFFRDSLNYLGFVVDKYGLRTNPDKIAAMVNFPQPKTTTEIKRFVGMCSWYRRFIPHFSAVLAPINNLLSGRKKGQKITWTKEADDSFNNIKQALVSAPVLASPDFSLPFFLHCDAANTGVGCVLTQIQGGLEKVIAFASRSLSKSERNYSTTLKELVACVFGCERFRGYIEGVKFTIITDHAALKWLSKLKDPSGQLARWSVRLSQFSFDIVHRKGKLNVVPDALSRSPVEAAPENYEEILAIGNLDDCISLDIDLSRIDRFYEKMRTNILTNPGNYPQWCVKNQYVYKLVRSKVPLDTNISEWKLLVPKPQRQEIVKSCHDIPVSAHLGFAKTYDRVGISYYWPKMRNDIFRYVRYCKTCGAQKAPNYKKFGFMGAEKQVRFPWQVIAVDLMGPLPRSGSGYQYLLVVSDWFTKYPVLYPLRQATSSSIVRFLENDIFLVYGVPQYIICDNGRQFVSKSIKKLVEDYNSKLWYTAYYHAQANFVERANRTICTAIRSYVNENHKNWDKEIAKIGYALRTAVHDVTGYSPSFLNFGRIVPSTGKYYGNVLENKVEVRDRESWAKGISKLKEIYQEVQSKIHAAHQHNARYYNLRRRELEFYVGDKVWKKNMVLSNAAQNFAQKLAPRYTLCTVHKKKSKLVYVLKNEDGTNAGDWHIQDLKPYHGSMSGMSEPENSSDIESEN